MYNEIDTQTDLAQSILCGSTTKLNSTIERWTSICSKTARKQLNYLRYKWKDILKEIFLDEHKREDVVEYRETFLKKMKLLLPYLVKFREDDTRIPKEYLNNYVDNYIVGRPNCRLVIMITHNKRTFSANNSHQKIWTLEKHGIFHPKGRGRGIMILDFLLPWSWFNLFSLPS